MHKYVFIKGSLTIFSGKKKPLNEIELLNWVDYFFYKNSFFTVFY